MFAERLLDCVSGYTTPDLYPLTDFAIFLREALFHKLICLSFSGGLVPGYIWSAGDDLAEFQVVNAFMGLPDVGDGRDLYLSSLRISHHGTVGLSLQCAESIYGQL